MFSNMPILRSWQYAHGHIVSTRQQFTCCKLCKLLQICSSDDDSSDEENTPPFLETSDSEDDIPLTELVNKSITEMLETPEKIGKLVTNVRQKAINSRALVVKRAVFNNERATSTVTSMTKAITPKAVTSEATVPRATTSKAN
jgi:hypothetical protein